MIALEPFGPEDFDRLISSVDSKESLVQFAGSYFDYPLTRDQLRSYLQDELRTIFRVLELESGAIIGHAEIFEVEEQMLRLCRVLIFEEELRGKGYGQEIIKQLLQKGFARPKVDVVELNVYKHNLPAIRCYEKCGFRRNPSGDKRIVIDEVEWISLNMILTKKEF